MSHVPVDLSPNQLGLVRAILARNGVRPEHQPVLFGSRVTGRARRYSDLDIGFAGHPLAPAQMRGLREDLEESNLPIAVDVLNLAETHVAVATHALKAAVPLVDAVAGSGE